jgi:hypothetical protein
MGGGSMGIQERRVIIQTHNQEVNKNIAEVQHGMCKNQKID